MTPVAVEGENKFHRSRLDPIQRKWGQALVLAIDLNIRSLRVAIHIQTGVCNFFHHGAERAPFLPAGILRHFGVLIVGFDTRNDLVKFIQITFLDRFFTLPVTVIKCRSRSNQGNATIDSTFTVINKLGRMILTGIFHKTLPLIPPHKTGTDVVIVHRLINNAEVIPPFLSLNRGSINSHDFFHQRRLIGNHLSLYSLSAVTPHLELKLIVRTSRHLDIFQWCNIQEIALMIINLYPLRITNHLDGTILLSGIRALGFRIISWPPSGVSRHPGKH